MKKIIHAKSSSGGSYEVEFSVVGDSVRVLCHCQAGVLHQMCKHKLAFIKGDTNMLYDPNQVAVLSEVRAWPQFGELGKRTREYEGELRRIETTKSALATEEKRIKAHFARGLAQGFK